MSFTAAGRQLLPDAREVVGAMDRLRGRGDALAREVWGRLVIGFIAGEAAMPYTHDILTQLAACHTRISVEMRSLGFGEQVEALAAGDVDAAFLRAPLPSSMQSMHLAVEPRMACLPANDSLATGAPITLVQLADYPMIDFPSQLHREWWDFWSVNPRPDGAPVRFGPVATDIEGGDMRWLSPAAQEDLRLRVVAALESGRVATYAQAAEVFGVAERPVGTWWRAFKSGGKRALLGSFSVVTDRVTAAGPATHGAPVPLRGGTGCPPLTDPSGGTCARRCS
ncbi:LysR substrate-binding domain-containing protein [Streptomyces sp. 21So2-11]|uniref:LysR substrate-binding domain-containing protein n=1 Tax=Streptomyces sp. 21So2-11 TaxID=3144408 RepID=UPI00321BBD0A